MKKSSKRNKLSTMEKQDQQSPRGQTITKRMKKKKSNQKKKRLTTRITNIITNIIPPPKRSRARPAIGAAKSPNSGTHLPSSTSTTSAMAAADIAIVRSTRRGSSRILGRSTSKWAPSIFHADHVRITLLLLLLLLLLLFLQTSRDRQSVVVRRTPRTRRRSSGAVTTPVARACSPRAGGMRLRCGGGRGVPGGGGSRCLMGLLL